jgi:hypothetical protein
MTRTAATILMILLFASACSPTNSVRRTIAGHTFEIPKENLVEATVFYLPSSQSGTLRFLINPQLPDQIMVSIDTRASCPSMDPAARRDPSCKVKPMTLDQIRQDHLERVFPWTGNKTQWEYRSARTGKLVAFCSALQRGGLCTYYGLYGELPFSVHLRDSEIARIGIIHRDAIRMLNSWEKVRH